MRLCLLFLVFSHLCTAQQVGDTGFVYRIPHPRFATGQGPKVVIDEAHRNFHTASGRYLPFAKLLRSDGYQVDAGTDLFTAALPGKNDILVIANATDGRPWALPTLSAFTAAEIEAVKNWVRAGGRLLLIADHMPMAGAADSLAQAFGFKFHNGFAVHRDGSSREIFCRAMGNLLTDRFDNGFVVDASVDSILAFTGQGFGIPPGASPVMKLGDDYEILLPDTAWRFHDNTPKIPGTDLYMGAVMRFGKGKLAVFGEAAMFTAQVSSGRKVGMNHPAARYNAPFLLDIIHWLSDKH